MCPKLRRQFQPEILTINVISGIVYFRDIILVSLQIVNETTPRLQNFGVIGQFKYKSHNKHFVRFYNKTDIFWHWNDPTVWNSDRPSTHDMYEQKMKHSKFL